MGKMKLWVAGIIVLGFMGIANAGTPGDKGNTFLKLGQGARAIGMGEAFVAVADDINSLYWNPAGLNNVKDIDATFMYADWVADIKYNYLGGVMPVAQLNGVMGASISLLDSGDIPRYDKNGNDMQGNFYYQDLVLAVSYARKFEGSAWGNSIGGTVKYINGKFGRMGKDDKDSTGFAIDIGGLGKPAAIDGLTVGWCVQNIGPKTSAFDKEKDGLPMIIKFGAAYNKLMNEALTVAMDVNLPADNDLNVHLGAEYNLHEYLAFRLGFRTDTIDEHDTVSGLTAGLGFKYPDLGLSLDYAYVDYDELGNTSRYSLNVGLSKPF